MTTVETPARPPRLAFGTTFRAAFRTVFGQIGPVAKVAALPFLLSLALLVLDFSFRAAITVGALPLAPDGGLALLAGLVLGLLALLPFAFLGIALTRFDLLAAQSGLLPTPVLGARTLGYAGYLLLLLVILVLLAAAGAFGGVALLQLAGLAQGAPLIVSGIAGFCLVLYLLLRLSLVLPAVAVDRKLGLIGSWRLTAGSSMRLLAIFLVLALAMAVGGIVGSGGVLHIGTPKLVIPEGTVAGSDWGPIVLANLPGGLWNLAVNFILFAMACGALASAYAQLSGWDGPREDILERFE